MRLGGEGEVLVGKVSGLVLCPDGSVEDHDAFGEDFEEVVCHGVDFTWVSGRLFGIWLGWGRAANVSDTVRRVFDFAQDDNTNAFGQDFSTSLRSGRNDKDPSLRSWFFGFV